MATPLRPMSLPELLDRSFFLYRNHFALFVGIAALSHLLLLAFQLAGVALQVRPGLGLSGLYLVWTLVTFVVYMAVVATSQGATVIAVSAVHLDRKITVAETFALMKGRILEISLIMIGIGIGIGMGFVLFVIPGIILALMWALTIPVAVLEETGLRDSVSRSAELTKGSRGRIFVIYFLFVVLTYIAYLLWQIPVLAFVGLLSRQHHAPVVPLWTQVAFPLGNFLTQCLVSPLLTIALSLVYYDQKVRKEAFDLQLMMSALDGAQGGTTTPATT